MYEEVIGDFLELVVYFSLHADFLLALNLIYFLPARINFSLAPSPGFDPSTFLLQLKPFDALTHTTTADKKRKKIKMSKIIFLLSILLFIGIYINTVEGCKGGWCHPHQGYKCCAGHSCDNYYFQGTCQDSAFFDSPRR
ncbi:uncharacterized protein LOC130665532 [Microplitis mediator]|uniref:uncharacterized protein LOC130665532 n=1 Tax=Microplitis mediator TaxID=375433 RepID=UPI00255412C9|nr:uncharacterized protein LOC130665532 [Microplitis mediator]